MKTPKQYLIVSLRNRKILTSFVSYGEYNISGTSVFKYNENGEKDLVFPDIADVFSVIEYKGYIPDGLRNGNYIFSEGQIITE